MVSHDISEIVRQAKHIACINGNVHYHATSNMPQEDIEEHFLKMLNKDRKDAEPYKS